LTIANFVERWMCGSVFVFVVFRFFVVRDSFSYTSHTHFTALILFFETVHLCKPRVASS